MLALYDVFFFNLLGFHWSFESVSWYLSSVLENSWPLSFWIVLLLSLQIIKYSPFPLGVSRSYMFRLWTSFSLALFLFYFSKMFSFIPSLKTFYWPAFIFTNSFFLALFFNPVKWISEFLISGIMFSSFRWLFDFYNEFQFPTEILYLLILSFLLVFFLKCQIVNILEFVDHTVSDPTIHPWHCGTKQMQIIPKQIIMAIFQ